MDRFQFSENYIGPWLEWSKDGHGSAKQAMESARAAFPHWDIIYIAKMRRLDACDLLPSPEQFVGEVAERVSVKLGSAITEEVMIVLKENGNLLSTIWDGVDEVLDDIDILVPDIIKGYKKGAVVNPNHFIGPAGMVIIDEASDIPDEIWEKPLPKLKDLM